MVGELVIIFGLDRVAGGGGLAREFGIAAEARLRVGVAVAAAPLRAGPRRIRAAAEFQSVWQYSFVEMLETMQR